MGFLTRKHSYKILLIFKKSKIMKYYKYKFVALIVTAAMFASCGGVNSSEGDKSTGKLSKNDILGNMPSLVYNKNVQDSIIKAKYKAQMDKLTEYSEKTMKKAGEISEKQKVELEEVKTKFQEDITKEKVTIVGNTVPYEVAEGAGYEVTRFVITDIQENGQVVCEFQVRITDFANASTTGFSNPKLIVTWMELDKSGNQIGANNAAYIDVSSKDNGASGTYKSFITINKKEAFQYVDFAKISFIR